MSLAADGDKATAPPRRQRLAPGALAAAVAALVVFQLMDQAIGQTIAKTAASSVFVALAWTAGARNSVYGRTILLGLVLSWFGDVFLLRSSEAFFLAGLTSFLLAHLAYIVAFRRLGTSRAHEIRALLPVAALSLAVVALLSDSIPGAMVWPVRGYTLAISVMVISAVGAWGRGAAWQLPAGALLFYVSDLAVATDRFADPPFAQFIWGLPAYYAGQYLLATSIGAVRRRERKVRT